MSVVADIENLAKASLSLDASARERCLVLAEEGKLYLQQTVESMIEQHPGAPLCIQFSADSTPIKLRTYTTLSGPTKKQRCSGETSTDFFVMQVFIGIATGDESVVEKLVFCDPVQLVHGKTMPSLSACVEQFLQPSWCHPSPESVTIFYQVHDRGMSKSFRVATSGHFIANSAVPEEMSELGCATDWDQVIFMDAGCALHDCHNALKWSFESICAGSTDTLKRLHIGISCYRSAACKAIDFLA
eukprot:6456017-Amphidinium_carterae.1